MRCVFQSRLVSIRGDAQKLHLGRLLLELNLTDRPHLVSCSDVRDVDDDQDLPPVQIYIFPSGSSVVVVVLPGELQQVFLVEKEVELSISVQL